MTEATTTDAGVAAPEAAAPAEPSTLIGASTEQTAEPEKSADEAAPVVQRVAPEKYEFALPEGVTIDSEVLGEFEGIARDLQMPQAEAAQMVERLAPKIQARVAKQMADAVAAASDEWSAASKSDKEFGGEKLAENLAIGEKALQAFGTPALSTLLKDTRLGNHPELIRFMVKAGKALAQDTVVVGRTAEPAKTRAERMYPTNADK